MTYFLSLVHLPSLFFPLACFFFPFHLPDSFCTLVCHLSFSCLPSFSNKFTLFVVFFYVCGPFFCLAFFFLVAISLYLYLFLCLLILFLLSSISFFLLSLSLILIFLLPNQNKQDIKHIRKLDVIIWQWRFRLVCSFPVSAGWEGSISVMLWCNLTHCRNNEALVGECLEMFVCVFSLVHASFAHLTPECSHQLVLQVHIFSLYFVQETFAQAYSKWCVSGGPHRRALPPHLYRVCLYFPPAMIYKALLQLITRREEIFGHFLVTSSF